MQLHTEQSLRCVNTSARSHILNHNNIIAAMRSYYSISFWDCALYNSVWQYDGTLLYDAARRYGLHVMITGQIRVHTMQDIRCRRYMLYMQLTGREDVKAGIKNYGYLVKEPVPAKRYGVRIHMEVFFPAETIDNVSVETSRHVAYYDGTLRYDGMAKYDALYRKEDIE